MRGLPFAKRPLLVALLLTGAMPALCHGEPAGRCGLGPQQGAPRGEESACGGTGEASALGVSEALARLALALEELRRLERRLSGEMARTVDALERALPRLERDLQELERRLRARLPRWRRELEELARELELLLREGPRPVPPGPRAPAAT